MLRPMVFPFIDTSSVPEVAPGVTSGAAPGAGPSVAGTSGPDPVHDPNEPARQDVSRSGGAPATQAQPARESRFAATDSPCVAVCSTLYDDICRGCGRTAMEVANWVFLSPEEKQVIWTRIRAEGYPRRKG